MGGYFAMDPDVNEGGYGQLFSLIGETYGAGEIQQQLLMYQIYKNGLLKV